MGEDHFLREQIERMRRLTERMSQMHRGVEENSRLITRDRESLLGGPLTRVRDSRYVENREQAPHRSPQTLAADSAAPRRRRSRGRAR
jgi:hypothetical protein